MIDSERLQNVPTEFQEQHSFCFWLHDMILDVMRQAEAARIADVKIEFKDEDEVRSFSAADDPVIFCLENGRVDTVKRIVMNQVVIPLYADALHFVHEGLRALEKRKYAVAFALFRKPLKYSLMFVTWIFADEEDFFQRMRTEPADSFDDRKLTSERRRELLQRAIAGLDYNTFLDADLIYGMAFDRNNARGLAQYFDKAAHLVTSHPAMRTENLNLNFIFKNPKDTDVYEGVYALLAYLLIYLLLLEVATIGRMAQVPSWYKKWLITASMSIHEGLFLEGSTNMIDHVNEVWHELLACVLCKSPLSITRENALRFFACERISCPKCKTEQQFPLFWIMSNFARGEPDESEEVQPNQ